ncbi:MAG: hypothetical protein KF787_10455 [Phycisphaeraceae bacterium]|nr:hypothetical protein [Phycisphaerae bacterium]MBX3393056.1 hypothetical protein [Phycisphaeraceae bacterium]HRJ48970.1 hypothetical protein [Phycisphaerales bacterium]
MNRNHLSAWVGVVAGLAVAVGVAASGTAFGQPDVVWPGPSGRQDYYCKPPGPPSGWACAAPTVNHDVLLHSVSGEASEKKPKAWKKFPACKCAIVPVGEYEPCSGELSYSETIQECWSVFGAVSTEIKIGALTRLISEFSIQLEVGSSIQGCKEWTWSMTYQIATSQCLDRFARIFREERTYTRVELYANTVHDYVCTDPFGMPVTARTWCGNKYVTAKVVLDDGGGFEVSQPPVVCWGYEHPPEWDGRYDVPCCSPLCQEVPPNELPCCGLIGND